MMKKYLNRLGPLVLLLAIGCDQPDLVAEQQELVDGASDPMRDTLTNEREDYPWQPGEREAAIAEAAEYNDLFAEELDFDPFMLQSGEDDDVQEAICELELVEPCIASWAICAVRCCDNTLHKSAQVCGNCGTWASGACAAHDTRKRIRWEWP